MRYVVNLLIIFLSTQAFANDLGVQSLEAPAPASNNSTPANPGTRYLGFTYYGFNSLGLTNDVDCNYDLNTDLSLTLNYFNKSCFDEGLESSDPYQNQIAVCNCLQKKNSSIGLARNKMTSSDPTDLLRTNDFSLNHLEAIMNDLDSKTTTQNNALILQTHLLGEGTSQKYGFTAEKMENKEYLKTYKKAMVETLQRDFLASDAKKAEFEKKFDKVISGIRPNSSILNMLAQDEPKNEGCIAFKNYLKFSSYPKGNSFWSSVKRNFNPQEWDIEKLENNFLDRNSSELTRDEAEEKINFLEKNPLIKYVFLSGNENASRKIFAVMQKYMSDISPDCYTQEMGSCRKAFEKKGLKDYMNELSQVLSSDEIGQAVQQGRDRESNKLMTQMMKRSQDPNNIHSLNLMAEKEFKVNLSYCITAVGNSLITPAISVLLEEKEKMKEICSREMPKYCQLVHKGANNSLLQQKSTDNMLRNRDDETKLITLYRNIANQLEPDPEFNSDYRADVKRYCEDHYRLVDGKSMNFEDYKKKTCRGLKTAAFCANKTELFAHFLENKEDVQRNTDSFSRSDDGDVTIDAFAKTWEIPKMNEENVKRYSSLSSVTTWLNGKQDKDKSFTADMSSVLSAHSRSSAESSSHQSPLSGPASFTQNSNANTYQLAASQMRDQKVEIDKEIKDTKAALDYNLERASRPNLTPDFKEEVDIRIASLEKILAEKERTSKEYQNIIDKLMNQSKQVETELAAKTVPKTEDVSVADASTATSQSGKSNITANLKPEMTEENHRAPASVSENFSTSGGASGGSFSTSAGAGSIAASSSAATSSAQARINTALLSKYGITVQDNNANVQIAADKEQNQISPLLSDAKQQDMGLEVTRSEFEKFKKHDLKALTDLYSQKIEMVNSDVVKLTIHTEGIQAPLEFYAIKEKGKVVFQPIRKNKLTDLQNALIQ